MKQQYLRYAIFLKSGDTPFGRPLLTIDWSDCNAIAILSLMQLNKYVNSLSASQNEEQPL